MVKGLYILLSLLCIYSSVWFLSCASPVFSGNAIISGATEIIMDSAHKLRDGILLVTVIKCSSMSRRGKCLDNSPMEPFFRNLKTILETLKRRSVLVDHFSSLLCQRLLVVAWFFLQWEVSLRLAQRKQLSFSLGLPLCLKASDLISWYSDIAGQIAGTKKPAGLAPCGLSGLHRMTLVITDGEFWWAGVPVISHSFH